MPDRAARPVRTAICAAMLAACLAAPPLAAHGPPEPAFGRLHPEAPPETAQFSFLIGEWACTIRSLSFDGSSYTESSATWIGRYALDGWAIADEWISPRKGGGSYHGTNIRTFNPKTGKWDNRWVSAPNLQWAYFEAEKVGDTMVMLGGGGTDPNGSYIDRNTFYEITADAWKWRKDRSYDGGASWIQGVALIEAKRVR